VLDFSKIEAGKLVFEMADFDLADAVDEAFTLLARRAQDKGVDFNACAWSPPSRTPCAAMPAGCGRCW
jgi:signal transduction histidine kinase